MSDRHWFITIVVAAVVVLGLDLDLCRLFEITGVFRVGLCLETASFNRLILIIPPLFILFSFPQIPTILTNSLKFLITPNPHPIPTSPHPNPLHLNHRFSHSNLILQIIAIQQGRDIISFDFLLISILLLFQHLCYILYRLVYVNVGINININTNRDNMEIC